MYFKKSFLTFLTLSSLVVPCLVDASDFQWRVSLNLRSSSDPYAYRYGLANRFAMEESDVIVVLDHVREPSDAYMVLRLAELSGRPVDYVLRVYNDRMHYGWNDVALYLGINPQMQEYVILKQRHDMQDTYYVRNYPHQEYYEERYPESNIVIIERTTPYRYPRYLAPPPRRHEPPRFEHREHHDYPQRGHEQQRPPRQDSQRPSHTEQQQRPPSHQQTQQQPQRPPRQEPPRTEQQQRPNNPSASQEQIRQRFEEQQKAEVWHPNNRLK